MSTLVMCPGCGHTTTVDADVAGRVACERCGKSLTRLVRPDLPPGTLASVPELDVGAMSAAPRRSVYRPRRPRSWLIPAVVACGLALTGGGMLAGFALSRLSPVAVRGGGDDDGWEAAHRAQFFSLRSDAQSRVLAGDTRGGYRRYDDLMRLAGEHAVRDPVLRDLIAAAAVDQREVYAQLRAMPDSRPAVATAPPIATPPPAATSPAPDPAPSPPAAVAAAEPAVPPSVVRPALPPIVPREVVFPAQAADRQVTDALNRGVAYLIGQFRANQLDDDLPPADVRHQGLDALCVYALLHAAEGNRDPKLDPHGPFLSGLIEQLKRFPMATDLRQPGEPVVYARSLRAAALAVFDRPEDKAALRADVAWLVHAQSDGAYTYDDRPLSEGTTGGEGADPPNDNGGRPGGGGGPPGRFGGEGFERQRQLQQQQLDRIRQQLQRRALVRRGPTWDNSNSQYGVLGVWAGADEADVEVPQAYWRSVEQHWTSCQLPGGQWGYTAFQASPRFSMTCAGVASLLITHEWLDAAALGTRVGRPPYSPPLAAGLKWLEDGDHCLEAARSGMFVGYSAYGLERCGLASGFKFFGDHDWFAELSPTLIASQSPGGGWGPGGYRTLVDTGYLVLFLSRGRHPVLMNKLRMDPYWDNRPRDLANLTAFASRALERPFNWQVVSFARPWSDWMDAPVLYVASHEPPKLTTADEDKLRAFANAGGLIFTHADSGSPAFSKWADDLARRLWPDLAGLQPLPADHPLFSVIYHLKSPPKMLGLSNGSRLLMVHSPTDLSPVWQERTTKSGRDTFGLGVNLFAYAAGKTNYRNRLDTPYLPDPPAATVPAVSVVRLKYPGLWDPEPYAWPRFARFLQWTTGVPLATTAVDLPSLRPGQAPVAVLTGTAAVAFTPADVDAVRAYVTAGGTLLVDACGGSRDFAASAQTLLERAFPGVPLNPLADDDPIVCGRPGWDDLTHPVARPYAAERAGLGVGAPAPALKGLTAGTGRVVFSRLDLTTGLLGTNTWAVDGYAPAYAAAAVKNVVLTAASGPR